MGSAVQHRRAVRPLGWLVAVCLLLSQVLALPAAFDAILTFAGHEDICRTQPEEPGGSDASAHQRHACCVLCTVTLLAGIVPPVWSVVPPAAARRTGTPLRRTRPIDRRRGPGIRLPRAPPR